MAVCGMDRNPFRPGFGDLPPVLAGREALKRELNERMEALRSGERRVSGFQLMGPRGCGKTAMLAWLEKEAEKKRIESVFLSIEAFAGIDMLVSVLKFLKGGVFGFGKGDLRIGAGIDGIPGLSVSAGIGGGPADRAAATVARHLDELARRRRRLLVLVDEAHRLPAETVRPWFDAFQAVARRRPMLLVVAGTPDLEMTLSISGSTFTERIMGRSVGRLAREDAARALTEPFGERAYFEDRALSAVLDEAQGYPYFVQLWGEALWNTVAESGVARIGMPQVEAAAAAVDEARQRLYRRRTAEMFSSGILIPAAETALEIGKGQRPTALNFKWTADRIAGDGDRAAARRSLLHTGFIWETKSGEWEYGIPSLAGHVVEAAALSCTPEAAVSPSLAAAVRLLKARRTATPEALTRAMAAAGADDLAADYLSMFCQQGLLTTKKGGKLTLAAPLLAEQVLKRLGIDPAAEAPAARKDGEETAARLVREGRLITRPGMKRASELFVVAEAAFVPGSECPARRIRDFLIWDPDKDDPGELRPLGLFYDALFPVGRVQDRWLAVRQDAMIAEFECLAGKSEEKRSGLDVFIAAVMRRRQPQPERSPPENDIAPTPPAEPWDDDGPAPGM